MECGLIKYSELTPFDEHKCDRCSGSCEYVGHFVVESKITEDFRTALDSELNKELNKETNGKDND